MATITIAGLNDLGSREGHRFFELFGSFPAADILLRRYSAQAWANNAWLNTRIDYESSGQINVAVPVVATGAASMFRVGLGDNGPWSNTFGPVVAREATIEIRGLRDRGRNGTGGWDVELYGEFQTDPLTATVMCDEQEVRARITHHSRGQVNVEFALPAAGASCTFELSRPDRQRTARFSSVLGRSPVRLSPSLAAYFWGGMIPPEPLRHDALIDGLSRLAKAGFRAARIRLTPELLRPELNVYNFDLNSWSAEFPSVFSLALAARSTYFQRAFNVAGLQTFVLTTYDAASMGPTGTEDNFYRPEWLADLANAAAVSAEYRDLTVALCETQNGTGKRFIIANWETDNHLYVDGVYGYVSRVRAGLPTTQSSPPPTERVTGFVRWFQLRKQGIEEGRAEARALGFTDVRVDDAVEFASYLLLQGIGAPSALFDVIPAVKPAVASYSAWETINAGRVDEDLPALQRQLGPATELILGEFGYEYMANLPSAAWRLIEEVKAAKRAHVPVITIWEAFTTIDREDGLLDFNGGERLILRNLRETDANTVPDMSGPIALLGIRDRGDPPNEGRRYFELYGRFPAAGTATYDVRIRCDDGSMPAVSIHDRSESQINVSIEIPSIRKTRWCVFLVQRNSDNAVSNEFGPRPLQPIIHVP